MEVRIKGLAHRWSAAPVQPPRDLQSTLADVFSGIILNTTRPYQIGDSISIDGTEGKVLEIDWRATRLLTGSVPDQVMRKANCPVLTVHPGRK